MSILLTSALRRRLRPALLAVAIVLPTACENYGPLIPRQRDTVAVGGGSNTVTDQLNGTWQNLVVFTDEFGFSHSTETVWEFRAAGTAVRTITTRNITLGLVEVAQTTARWRVEDTNLVIEFLPPESGQVTLQFFFQGDQLVLGGQTFTRVSG